MEDPTSFIEGLLERLERESNFLRGLSCDPTLPAHVVSTLVTRERDLDDFIEEATNTLESA